MIQIVFQPTLGSLMIKLATSRCKEQQVVPAGQRGQENVSTSHSTLQHSAWDTEAGRGQVLTPRVYVCRCRAGRRAGRVPATLRSRCHWSQPHVKATAGQRETRRQPYTDPCSTTAFRIPHDIFKAKKTQRGRGHMGAARRKDTHWSHSERIIVGNYHNSGQVFSTQPRQPSLQRREVSVTQHHLLSPVQRHLH